VLAPFVGLGGTQDSELTVDPITEASVRLLQAAGLENYGDEGIAAVVAAVQAANLDTDFAGLTAAEANDTAEATAADDPSVQTALEENLLCVGDCDGNGLVRIDELIFAVNIALELASAESCPAVDPDGDGVVRVNELIRAVNSSLDGCP
jgi:hypothetical protein